MKRILYLAIALSAFSASYGLRAQGTGKMETIYSFVAPPGATYPAAGPIISQSGVIYGTTSAGGPTTGCGYFNCGTVYELTPPGSPGGAWTESTLYSFKDSNDGYSPLTGLVFGPGGTLYGWAAYGGPYGRGSAYELTPPASPGGIWTETTIYAFKGPPSDGGSPAGGFAIGAIGSLYGTTYRGGTYNQGTVFELTPPASPGGAWTLSVLYSFRGDGDGVYPNAGVVIGGKGAIYGTTSQGGALGYGTVFALELVAWAWEERVLFSLSSSLGSPDGLTPWHNGALYGQTPSNIFEATPPAAEGGTWTVQSLTPGLPNINLQSVTVSLSGAIYWTNPVGGTSTACGDSQGCGTLNELMPPSSPGGKWTLVVLHSFTGQDGDGYQPNAGLVVTKSGSVFGTTYYGGQNFFGTVFRYTP